MATPEGHPVARGDAGELARMLAGQIASLVVQLLPAGRKEGNEWVHPSLTGGSRRSLSVHLAGTKSGVWADFATGEQGDALDLVATVACGGDVKAAMAWARAWLGLAPGSAAIPARPPPPAPDPAAAAAEEEGRRRAAVAMFLAAQERLGGTPVAAYLAGRGIDLAELSRQPRSLRYHPAAWNRESGRAWPAMVAGVTNDAGDMVAVHRTWLAPRGGDAWGKAPLRDPKMSLGRLGGGCIRLWRGASRKPLARASDGEVVAIGEGIETALSVVVAYPELRVLCGVSLANMASIVLPPAIRTVILLKDDDGDNLAARRGFARVVDHFLRGGHIVVKVAHPPVGGDFNDTLQAETV